LGKYFWAIKYSVLYYIALTTLLYIAIQLLIQYKALPHYRKNNQKRPTSKKPKKQTKTKRSKRKSDDTTDNTNTLANQMTQTKARKILSW